MLTDAPVYDAAYFIAKFEAIPEEKWTTGNYSDYSGDCLCALGHCGETARRETPEANALRKLARESRACPAAINDGEHPLYKQPTPKQRVLAWLRDAQKAGL